MLNNKYLTLYRQYRPKTFSEIKGQDHIVQTLKNIILSNKIGHAYLFCGPHGNGKTSTAKVFANTINCSHRDFNDLSPCLDCINNIDRNLDIIEIDAASNTGIDDIRELREKIKHLPSQSPYKIYIIDEVHMLSKGAFNALLKTLEEPPQHVIFILATTDPQKIPLTILSRVQRFNFKKMDCNILFNELKRIFENEKILASDEVIKLITKLGNGSFRDTLSIADQVAIYSANKAIEIKDVQEIFGITDVKNVIDLINLLNAHELKSALNLLKNLIYNGTNIDIFLNQIVETLKDYLFYLETKDATVLENTKIEDINLISLVKEKAYEYVDNFIDLIKNIKYSDMPLQTFEITLIKLSAIKAPNEVYKNTIENVKSPIFDINKLVNDDLETQTKENKQEVEEHNDFVYFENEEEINNELKSETKSNFDSNSYGIPSLSSVANDDAEENLETVNIDDLIKQTDEIILSENTAEFENSDIANDIITAEFDNTFDNLNTKATKTTITLDLNEVTAENKNSNLNVEHSEQENKFLNIKRSHVDFNDLVNCFLIRILTKKGTQEFKEDLTEVDKIKYADLTFRLLAKEFTDELAMLQNLKIVFSNSNFIIVSSEFEEKIEDINLNAYTIKFQKAIKKLFDRYMHVFGVTENEVENIKNWWHNNKATLQSMKPKLFEDLNPYYEVQQKEKIAWAKSTFGNIFKMKK
ncbi:DNA polymerase III subunit gamma/tau [Mycoplasma struthionis]|uniref:DNA polymerase III subunit gamma/tau n=1 Tax=Mycoplasma struthionis TaxID=538220 RepID=A0A3G8LHT6_9MOLU|nr:DNA polymerase III subunit gamma/tau [Mycoplasma struthionis]AZG68924.1 DNA polymerase III subunit gamma/tau [Mycoplasma struthionis]